MVEQPERRAYPRYDIDWPVALYQKDRDRLINGRGQDLSRGGALVALPLSVPLRLGQEVEVRLQPRTGPTQTPGNPQTPQVHNARVVRVQRGPRLLDGLQLVGLMFDP